MPQHRIRWPLAALLLACAAGLAVRLVSNTEGSPTRLAILLALPIAIASLLCLVQRAERWARWLSLYAWIAALVLYLEPVTEVWPFGVLTLAVVSALALASSFLIPDTHSRKRTRPAATRPKDAA